LTSRTAASSGEALVQIERPFAPPLHEDGGHPVRLETHRVTAGWRELFLREEFPNPDEHEMDPLQPYELHTAKADARVAVGVVGEDDLVSRQRHSELVIGEEYERPRGTISDNPKPRDPILLPDDR
jgi:hypothetical protein